MSLTALGAAIAAFTGIGAGIGIFFAALIVLPFNTLIAEKLSVPFALSSPALIILFAVLTFVISVVSSVFSAVFGAVKLSNQKVW